MARHLVAVHLDDRVLYVDLGHGYTAVVGARKADSLRVGEEVNRQPVEDS